MHAVKEKVDRLESILGEFIIHTDVSLSRLEREVEKLQDEMRVFKDEMKDFKDEMKDFKDEMKDFKDEMKDFKDEMRVFKDEMKDFKDEMRVFKDEMKDFKDEMSDFKRNMEADRKEINKQWAYLAKKMGTLDEDLVAPAVRPVLAKYFDCEPLSRSIRNLRRIDGDTFEIDVLASCKDRVFMIEVKSSPKTDHIEEILEKATLFKRFFPEYENKEVIPIFAGITFPENVVKYATRKDLYVMEYKEWEYMDIINFEEVKSK
jgi:predicted RNase H-like nuclease (RuvC/YqgF family)